MPRADERETMTLDETMAFVDWIATYPRPQRECNWMRRPSTLMPVSDPRSADYKPPPPAFIVSMTCCTCGSDNVWGDDEIGYTCNDCDASS